MPSATDTSMHRGDLAARAWYYSEHDDALNRLPALAPFSGQVVVWANDNTTPKAASVRRFRIATDGSGEDDHVREVGRQIAEATPTWWAAVGAWSEILHRRISRVSAQLNQDCSSTTPCFGRGFTASTATHSVKACCCQLAPPLPDWCGRTTPRSTLTSCSSASPMPKTTDHRLRSGYSSGTPTRCAPATTSAGSARRGPSLDGINEVFDRMERGQIDGRIVIDYR
jgi:hypothetical protein